MNTDTAVLQYSAYTEAHIFKNVVEEYVSSNQLQKKRLTEISSWIYFDFDA